MEDILLYASGAVIAFMALRHIVFRVMLSRAHDHPPRPGSPLAALGIDARLRDFYRLAVAIEEEGARFYLKLAERVSAPGTQKLCRSLAADEALHRQRFQDQLDKWRELPVNPREWPVLLAQAKKAGIFTETPAEDAPEEALARFAIQQEINSARFYRLFEHSYPEAWKRAKMLALAREEDEHERKLRAAYPRVII